MFDSTQPPPRQPLTQAVTVCAIGAGVGFGTCGIGLLIGRDNITPALSSVGAFVFFASVLGLLVIGLIAVGRALVDFFTK